jgi:signal transduction histidine kinase
MRPSAWSTQQLAEFLAVVSSAQTEASAAHAAVERAAESLDADVAAIVCDGDLVAAVGYPEGAVPVAELGTVRPDRAGCQIAVPGVGMRPATAVALEHPPGATLVVACSGPDALRSEDAAVLRGMARVASMTMRMQRLLDDERTARELLERLAEEQAALRRVATLVAGQARPDDIFHAVAEEAGRLLRADAGTVCRYEPDGTGTVVAAWSENGRRVPVGTRATLEDSLSAKVLQSGAAARLDSYEDRSGPVAELVGELGLRSSVGAPILVEGRIWGAMIAFSNGPEPLPADSELRLAGFTELAATAISNAASRAQLAASRARVVTAADESRRRIERDLHDGIQQRLVTLALGVQAVREDVPAERDDLRARLSQLHEELGALLDDVREISRGVHPAVLTQGGLGPALGALAGRSTVRVELDVGAVGRLPEPFEVAAYYVVSEAVTNANKHASASVAHVRLEVRDQILHLAIRDDGAGGADPEQGSGLLGLTDRVEALGGTLAVRSPSGEGTSIVVQLPLTAAADGRVAPPGPAADAIASG